MFAYGYIKVQMLKEAKGIRSPAEGIMVDYELPDMGAGNCKCS